MKYLYLSFLFFLFSFIGFTTPNFNVNQDQDSLGYYNDMGKDPVKSTSLSRYQFYVRKKEESIRAKDTTSTIYYLRYIAIIQNNLGDYYGSEASAVEALQLLDHQKVNPATTEARVALYNQLGRINRALFNYNIALEYYNKALALSDNQNYKNIIQNNKFLIYTELKDYEIAETEFLDIYQNSLKSDDVVQTNRALDNLGFIQSKLQRPEALPNLLQALRNRLGNNDLSGAYSSYRHLTIYYMDRADKTTAKQYAQKAYETALLIKNSSFIEDALSYVVDLSDDPMILKYKTINDSITRAKQVEENKYALVKYNYAAQERIAKENEIEKERQKRLKLWYLGLGMIVLLLSVASYFILNTKHKKDKLQEVYHTESRISKKVHDEVANEVYHVITKIQGANHNEDVLDDLEDIYNKTRDISKQHGAINVRENFTELLNDLLLSYKTDEVNIITKNLSKINWDLIPEIKKTALYRVLQELMTNMRKHSKANAVVLSFDQTNKKVSFTYKDNGVGCNLKKGGGLTNTENRIKSINGTITFESQVNHGFNVKITV